MPASRSASCPSSCPSRIEMRQKASSCEAFSRNTAVGSVRKLIARRSLPTSWIRPSGGQRRRRIGRRGLDVVRMLQQCLVPWEQHVERRSARIDGRGIRDQPLRAIEAEAGAGRRAPGASAADGAVISRALIPSPSMRRSWPRMAYFSSSPMVAGLPPLAPRLQDANDFDAGAGITPLLGRESQREHEGVVLAGRVLRLSQSSEFGSQRFVEPGPVDQRRSAVQGQPARAAKPASDAPCGVVNAKSGG